MAQPQHVRGLEGLLTTLKALPAHIVSKGGGPVRASLRAAGIPILKAAQENVRAIVAAPNKDGEESESTGLLEKSIILSRRKPRPNFKGEHYQVRVRRSARSARGQSARKYGGVLEFGDETHKAEAWLRRAFEQHKGEALSIFIAQMRKRLDAAIRKARKQGFRV